MIDDDLISHIRDRAGAIDRSGAWPADDLREIAHAGLMRAAIPRELGGDDRTALDIHLDYERIASASLGVALILSQRDSACSLIDGAEDFPHRDQFLRELAANQWFTTVGIAQLTTSRQPRAPALLAKRDGDGYLLNGTIPWCTGAPHALVVVAGAVEQIDDVRKQILFALPCDASGVRIDPTLDLVALRSTHTAAIRCEDVRLDRSLILRGPTDQALSGRRRNLSIGQAFLAMGLCRGAHELIGQIDSDAARASAGELGAQLDTLRGDVLDFVREDSTDGGRAATLRGRCNELAVRITHAAVALHKGSALLADHPAQRLARESMFLLVWSCPGPVVDCTVDLLSGRV